MQKKAIALLLFLSFTLFNSGAQNENNDAPLNSQYIFSNIFSFTPIYGGNQRITLGYLIQTNDKWMYGLELGYGDYSLLYKDARSHEGIDKGYQLFEIRPSINYLFDTSSGINPYIAAELFYISQKDVFVNNTEYLRSKRYINNGSIEPALIYDKANFSRKKYGLNLNAGVLVKIIKRIGINANIGLGLRNREISYKNTVNTEEITAPDINGFRRSLHLLETGNTLGLNINFDIKVSYRIN